MKDYSRVAAYIDLDAIYDNLRKEKQAIKLGTRLCVVIKTDGYGHGAVPIAKKVDELADFYAVATIDEAVNLRRHNIGKPILILGYTPVGCYEELVNFDIRPNVYEIGIARELSKTAQRLGKTVRIHLKLDTGMGRLGFLPTEEAVEQMTEISRMPGIVVEGLFSHFAKADEADKMSSEQQLAIYLEFVRKLKDKGLTIPICHISNSAGIIDLPQANLDMVRSGISTYGLYPSCEVNKKRMALKPALSLKSRIVYLKTLPAGCGISYGSIYVTEKDTKIATIPVGYGDGYPRNLSNKGYVLIRGKKAPIRGRVCMDQFMVDVSDIEGAAEGDEVTLIGYDGEESIAVEELAEMSGTFNYEFVCDLGKRIPRVFLSEGKIIGSKDYFLDEYQIDC